MTTKARLLTEARRLVRPVIAIAATAATVVITATVLGVLAAAQVIGEDTARTASLMLAAAAAVWGPR